MDHLQKWYLFCPIRISASAMFERLHLLHGHIVHWMCTVLLRSLGLTNKLLWGLRYLDYLSWFTDINGLLNRLRFKMSCCPVLQSVMFWLDNQHIWEEDEVTMKMYQISPPLKNNLDYSPVGIDLCVFVCFCGIGWFNFIISKEQKTHISNFMFYLLNRIRSLISSWKNHTQA